MDGETVLTEAVAAYQTAMGNRLLAAFALGSLAHGGFSNHVSDVDLGLIIRDPIQPDDTAKIQAVAEAEKAKGSDLHARLSVFWGTPSTLRGKCVGGRFPAIDRLDLIENGRRLTGSDHTREDLPRPSYRKLIADGAQCALDYLADVRPAPDGGDKLSSGHFAGQNIVQQFRSPQLLVSQGVRWVTKVILFPARFLYTATTGGIGTNDDAVEHHLADPRAPSKELVAAARTWRTGAEFDEIAACQLLGQQIVPLYLYYIDDHIPRLDTLGENQLATWFRRWRERLQT